MVQIYGSALATGTAYGTVVNGRLSTAVTGTSVKIGGLDAPIAYASPTQINVQVPSELQANRQYQVIVNTGGVYSKNPAKLEKAQEVFHVGNLYLNRKCTGAMVGAHPFGGFNMSGTDSKTGGKDYLLLFLQGKSIAEKI